MNPPAQSTAPWAGSLDTPRPVSGFHRAACVSHARAATHYHARMQEVSYTIAGPCSHQVEIRKSRFVAQAAPVSSASEALEYVHGIAADGTSKCWAYRVGQTYRFSDDNEPSGSAGKPILAAIDGRQLDGVALVVTRWFGGIKLGIGGLIRAYGRVAAECLREAERVAIIPRVRMILVCGHAEYARITPRMATCDVHAVDEHFDARGVTARVSLPARSVAKWRQLVADITHGQGVLESDSPSGESEPSASDPPPGQTTHPHKT